ncbi:hypothetical protein APY04_3530 [Hyphomicrobium sulfonivorans]|uniref:Uncharacterized protein n=1 Tax=Hyphomicrobium sulfonivorans TaxID=121290 RepID=A0A109B8P9_HYPSL|nr:hypothetical protein APY04_3530 [Hyphomicrobium sulfonivorans]
MVSFHGCPQPDASAPLLGLVFFVPAMQTGLILCGADAPRSILLDG